MRAAQQVRLDRLREENDLLPWQKNNRDVYYYARENAGGLEAFGELIPPDDQLEPAEIDGRWAPMRRQAQLALLAFKAGSTPEAARAARSHTAAMAGDDAIFEAACRQAGVLRCDNFMDMFAIAGALSHQPLPKKNRVAVISPGGGFCVTTAEACTRLGLELPEMTAEAQIRLRAEMTPFAPPPVNPIDSIGRKNSQAYLNIIEIVAAEEYIDGIILTPRLDHLDRSWRPEAMIKKVKLAEATAAIAEKYNKPLICASEHELEGTIFEIFKRRHIPFFDNPFDCAKVMAGMVQYAGFHT